MTRPMTYAALALAALSLAGCAPRASTPMSVADPAASCTGASEVDTVVYLPESVARKPTFIDAPTPEYPEELKSAHITGRVVVSFIIGADGKAERASLRTVEAANIDFSNAAMASISKALFTPACRDGHPVRVRVTMPVEFKLTY